jgi:glycosyltransferase involved in cell wall biosynthesis
MRILLIHNQLWAHYKSKLFSEINKVLADDHAGDKFKVVHIALHEASRKSMTDDDAYSYDYPYEVLFQKSLDQVGFKEKLSGLFRAYKAFKPNVLNVTGYFDWAQIILMTYARLCGVKVVLSSESSPMDHDRSAVKEFVKKWIVSQADLFFCFGKSSADYLLSLGVREDQIPVRNAAVVDEEIIRAKFDSAKNTINKRDRNFIYVGRLAPEKNLEILIATFLKIEKKTDWGLIFVGDGPSRESLEKLASGDNSIKFVGGFPWYKVPEWLAQSDVLVLPSNSEPWGLVVNEAMVCGMPVIVSDKCGCVPDLLHNGVNGFSFNPRTQSELEKAILFFMQNPEKIDAMGRQSESIVAPFSARLVAREMVKCYRRLCESKKTDQ